MQRRPSAWFHISFELQVALVRGVDQIVDASVGSVFVNLVRRGVL